MKQYAMNTVGVNKPMDFLDFGDTFLDEKHLKESFDGHVVVEGADQLDRAKRYNFKLRFSDDDTKTVEAIPLPHQEKSRGNPVRFTPIQVEAVRSGLLPGLTLVVGPPGTGKTDVAVQIISSLYHTYPTQRTIIITHSNAALNDIFSKVMARGDIDERYFVRLGAGERDLETESSHDFTKIGRVAYSVHRRGVLLEQVQQLSEALGVSGRAQRGADGSPSYTCETAEYFRKQHVVRLEKLFEKKVAEDMDVGDDTDVSDLFPFSLYVGLKALSLVEAKLCLIRLDALFKELAEYRPFELLRSQRQRADYLITKQARIIAMTCTHAAIVRSNLIEMGFEYDNLVMEESAQMLEIESFIPCLLQKGKSDDAVSGLSRLKRVCMLGDHNQLPPVVKNASFASFSNLDQSLFARLIRLGVPYVQLDKQGRARPEIMKLYRFVHYAESCFVLNWRLSLIFLSLFAVGDTTTLETWIMLLSAPSFSWPIQVLCIPFNSSMSRTLKAREKLHQLRSITRIWGRPNLLWRFSSTWS
jgi:intron-binding protein aquarius